MNVTPDREEGKGRDLPGRRAAFLPVALVAPALPCLALVSALAHGGCTETPATGPGAVAADTGIAAADAAAVPDAAGTDTRDAADSAPEEGAADGGPPDTDSGVVPAPDTGPPPPDLVDEALRAAGLHRDSFGYDSHTLSFFPSSIRADPYRLSWYDDVQARPLAVPAWVEEHVLRPADRALAGDSPLADLILLAADLLDAPARLPEPLPPPAGDDPLAVALAALIENHSPDRADRPALVRRLAAVPRPLHGPLAALVAALDRAAAEVSEVIGVLDRTERRAILRAGPGLAIPGPAVLNLGEEWVQDLLQGRLLDSSRLHGAAAGLAAAVTAFGAAALRLPADTLREGFRVVESTPVGLVVLSGGGDDLHLRGEGGYAGPVALLVDTGGNDEYRMPAGSTERDLRVGVLVDLGGDDRYGYVEEPHELDGNRLPSDSYGRLAPAWPLTEGPGPFSLSMEGRQGSALLGIGILADFGSGRDTYRTLRMGQGFGSFGVGVLFDDGGDDSYDGEAAVQAAGVHGVGILLDGGGRDSYHAYTMSQGFGYVGSVGLLVDAGGDDAYVAHPGNPAVEGGDPLYFSPQMPGTGNSSMSQGFGFGRRAAGTREDQHFMSGGIGVLRDLFGNDTYRADVFAQGGGYWFGTGVLADAGGDDVYDGEWYTQGAAAHFALGVLLDDAGNDDHNPHGRWMNVEAGGGHDFSVGILVDGAGNDRYKVPGLSLGAGNANGIGLFVDRTGDDAYESQSGASLGWASLSGEVRGQAPRRARPTFGLFLDGGGADTYVHPDAGGVGIGNGRLWTRAADSDEEVRHNEHGVGLDGEGPIRLGP